jgi:DNA-binding MarR family transcriptional regulator
MNLSSADGCAREVLEVVPLVMREIRHELRRYGVRDISMPQFRTLLFLDHHKGASLSEVADHIGLTLPSASSMVDALVTRGLAKRETHSDDRRRMTLTLTDRGARTLKSARDATVTHLESSLKDLTTDDRNTISKAMQTLRSVFGGIKK